MEIGKAGKMNSKNTLKGKRAVILCRSSRDDLNGNNCYRQSEEIRKWASKNDVIIASEYYELDNGNYPRPILDRALTDMFKLKAQILVCYEPSRLTRDAEALEMIMARLGKKQVYCLVPGGFL